MIICAKCNCVITEHHKFKLAEDRNRLAEHVNCHVPVRGTAEVTMNFVKTRTGYIFEHDWEGRNRR